MHAKTGIRQNANPISNQTSDTLPLPSQRSLLSDSNARWNANTAERNQILSVTYLAIHSLFGVSDRYGQTATHAEMGIRRNANHIGKSPSDKLALPSQRPFMSDSNERWNGNTAERKSYQLPTYRNTRSSESTVITVRQQRMLKRKYGRTKILPVAYLAIHPLFRVNGDYCQTAIHAEAEIRQTKILSVTYLVNTHYCLTATHAEKGIRQNANRISTYVARHSLFRDNGHYRHTATPAETWIRQKAYPIANTPSDKLVLPSQRSILSDSNACSNGNAGEHKSYL